MLTKKEIVLAGGCFWGTEKYFQEIKGVTKTQVGYANGKTMDPSYDEVRSGNAEHAEVVKVTYEPEIVSLGFLLEMYYAVIDPVVINRQGNDRGIQYRTGIYYEDASDESVIRGSLEKLQKEYRELLGIEVERLNNYAPAEGYHQNYLNKNPGGYCHINEASFIKARQAKDSGVKK
jgi:peptide methionine sulfoxide reductase msrA/msrB